MDRTKDIIKIKTSFLIVLAITIISVICMEKEERKEKAPVATSQQVVVQEERKQTAHTQEMQMEEHRMEEQMTEEQLTEEQLTEEQLQEELYCDSLEELAILVEAEAGNQDITGKRYVAAVVLNRVDHPEFPDTIKEVIEQPPRQFSTFWNGAMDRATPSEETYEAVRMELQERINTEVLFFTAGGYGAYGKPWKKIGDHYFCTWK